MNEKKLQELASRVAALIREIPQYRAIYDVLAGAIFALLRAQEIGYKHRDRQLSDKYLQNLALRLEKMTKGILPRSGPWLAGFHFNAAIQRIAAAGEQLKGILTRIQREAVRSGKDVPYSLAFTGVGQVCEEVNRFKHDETGLDSGRDVTPPLVFNALEEIIDAFETCLEALRGAGPRSRKKQK